MIVERTAPFRFAVGGLEADFFIPQEHVAFAFPSGATPAPRDANPGDSLVLPDRPLDGVRALLVEDNMLIALDAEEMMNDLGAASGITVSTLQAAADAMADAPFGFAMLDINLDRSASFDFALRLARAGLPHIFASGYGDQIALVSDHARSIVIQKPYERDHLRRAVLHANPASDYHDSIGSDSICLQHLHD